MTLFRFALVGLGVAALYVGTFLVLLDLGIAKFTANILAFALAIIVQYIGQATFTFRQRLDDHMQMMRFLCMIAAGFLSASVITTVVGPALDITDMAAAILVTLLLPIQNYFIMKLWVFTQSPQTDEVAS